MSTTKIVLSILPLPNVVAGKFVTYYAVVDQSGELVGAKSHKTEAEAEVELGSLKFYAKGLEFARAVAPEGASDKSLVGKANIVASFLLYQEKQEAVDVSEVEASTETEAAETAVNESEEF